MEPMNRIPQLIVDVYAYFGLHISTDGWLYLFTVISLLAMLGAVSLFISKNVLGPKITRLISLSKAKWDDELHKHRFFRRIAHIATALILYLIVPILLPENERATLFFQKLVIVYLLLSAVGAGSAILNTIESVYNGSLMAQRAPITGFIQVGKLVIVIVALLLIIANLLDKSPLLLLSGLGAITAVLMLVFKDAILGFVAGIQIAANRMLNTGDWIEMPSYGADGTVLQVGLTTVKVQNWDKTISTIPTYALISDSVKNWRGMSESAGRRIKRAINIDIKSIEFCSEEDIEALSKIRHINQYIARKRTELAAYHQDQNIDIQDLVNHRRLTNIGTFRAYLEAYLRHHPKINKEMTLMVRQLPPTATGVPLEIYCFSADKEWINYEGIQADIFDHVMAMLPVFKLRSFQHISDSARI
ncbi:mechanosensitive ion channel family protein [Aestuariibacter sp. AA17]|uniref:Mechanosensitive ion channel family protein n=2 Tax=Fluctibacter corallii TaxID=2984329 RepID=A0ABT3A7Z7_9ALTE|nr:mechanosensitive ion channel family protein [Aestuariibacter sp. AA17]MCV2884694.1 mechanosensitive ion channel family protein [Aestuariibacter sp. AA17]